MQFAPVFPEMFVLAMVALILVVDAAVDDGKRYLAYVLSLVTLAGAAFLTVRDFSTMPVLALHGLFIDDPLSDVLKLFLYLTVAVVLVYSRDYLRQRGLYKGEFFVLALFALLVRVPRVRALPLRRRAVLLLAALVAMSIPVDGLSLAGFVRGITGDLSISTLVLMALALVRSLSGHVPVAGANRMSMLRAIAVVAVLFYPLVLGLTMFDPYRLGYGNLWFMAALLAGALWSGLRYSTLLAWCIALAVAAWSAGWYESPNLWDYLLDPWLAIYALAVQGKFAWVLWRRRHA